MELTKVIIKFDIIWVNIRTFGRIIRSIRLRHVPDISETILGRLNITENTYDTSIS